MLKIVNTTIDLTLRTIKIICHEFKKILTAKTEIALLTFDTIEYATKR